MDLPCHWVVMVYEETIPWEHGVVTGARSEVASAVKRNWELMTRLCRGWQMGKSLVKWYIEGDAARRIMIINRFIRTWRDPMWIRSYGRWSGSVPAIVRWGVWNCHFFFQFVVSDSDCKSEKRFPVSGSLIKVGSWLLSFHDISALLRLLWSKYYD